MKFSSNLSAELIRFLKLRDLVCNFAGNHHAEGFSKGIAKERKKLWLVNVNFLEKGR